jgi:hypothetical protein
MIGKNTPNNISAIYVYGSRVYGNFSNTSDYDYLVVCNNKIDGFTCETEDEFLKKLEEHDIRTLECFFSPDEFKYEIEDWIKKISTFKINNSKLRHSISAKASHSWVKAKKKFTVENEDYIGIKSFYHAFRIVMFGIQIAKAQKIYNFSEANYIWEEVRQIKDWDILKDKYKSKFNNLNSEFRKLAEK